MNLLIVLSRLGNIGSYLIEQIYIVKVIKITNLFAHIKI